MVIADYRRDSKMHAALTADILERLDMARNQLNDALVGFAGAILISQSGCAPCNIDPYGSVCRITANEFLGALADIVPFQLSLLRDKHSQLRDIIARRILQYPISLRSGVAPAALGQQNKG